MAKQKIYAIGSSVSLAPLSWLLRILNPYTAIIAQKEITKELLTPAISSKMKFYPDLKVALEQASKRAKDYGDHGYYNDFPPVFLVEIEDRNDNQKFEVTEILKAYVIKTPQKDAPVLEYEINILAKQALENKNQGISSMFSSSTNTDPKIICNKNNYHGDFSALQLNKQRWTLCNVHFFGVKEGRGGIENHVAKLPEEVLQNICGYLARSPLKMRNGE
jgi:hypothetical protein